MVDPLVAPFAMHGARDVIAGGLSHILEQVEGIERAVVEKPSLAFDLAKTLVESVCRTVLSERNVPFSEDDDLPKLFKTAANHLPFLPPTASGESKARESLKRTLSGLSGAIQGICELRNQCGFASHGSDKPRPAMESVQALLAAQAADTIVGFLHRVHRQQQVPSSPPRVLYEVNPAFDESVDEVHGMIRIFAIEFRPSEVLFRMEPESYRVYLAEFTAENNDNDSDPGGPEVVAP